MLDERHMAMKKPKRSGSKYYNYKGFSSLVLPALDDSDKRFLWVGVGSSGSSSDALIFNHSKLKKKIGDDTLGLLVPETLVREGPIWTTFCGVSALLP